MRQRISEGLELLFSKQSWLSVWRTIASVVTAYEKFEVVVRFRKQANSL